VTDFAARWGKPQTGPTLPVLRGELYPCPPLRVVMPCDRCHIAQRGCQTSPKTWLPARRQTGPGGSPAREFKNKSPGFDDVGRVRWNLKLLMASSNGHGSIASSRGTEQVYGIRYRHRKRKRNTL